MKKKNYFDQFILLLISMAFALVNWRLGFLWFSDLLLVIIFAFIILYFIINKKLTINIGQIFLLIIVSLLVLTNILFHLFFNKDFLVNESLLGFLKIIFYITTVILLFNFIQEKKLKDKLLSTLSITAVVVSIIGIYISLSLYLKGILPYEFFWHFIRQDMESYTYRGWDRSIIRTKSIFSEPSFLGFYLNTILAILYFSKSNYRLNKSHIFIITLTILLTFSYSSILIMVGIKILHYIEWKNFISFLKRKSSIFTFILSIILVVFFWGTIEKTVIIRTKEIFSGVDGSSTARLQGSWSYINGDNIVFGNGIGNTPTIFNVYAYILSDLGIVSFLLFLFFTGCLIYYNPQLALIFIALNFQKGGYLGAMFWIYMLLIVIYSIDNKKTRKSSNISEK